MEQDLSVDIAGVTFRNPVIVASGPPTLSSKHIIKAIDAGAAGAVTKTITYDVMQQIQPKPRMYVINSKDMLKGKFYSFYSIDLMSELKPEAWVEEIRRAKEGTKNKGVIIASIAGRTFDEWGKLTKLVNNAGADMIELNLSCPHIEEGELMGRAATSDPRIVERIIKTVKEESSIPVIGKLTLQGANPVNLAKVMASSGIDVLVSTARFQGLVIDVNEKRPILWGGFGGYGGPWQVPISVGWTAHIAMEKLGIPIIGSGGISNGKDAIKFMLVGATAVQMCTAIMMKGYEVIPKMIAEIREWMEKNEFTSIREFVGISLERIIPLDKLSREKMYKVVVDLEKCTGCGVCVRVCPYMAISMSTSLKGKVEVDRELCDNCGLCISVCPFDALRLSNQNSLVR